MYDGLTEEPEGTFWQKWIGGLVVPVLLFCCSVLIWSKQTALLPGRWYVSITLRGPEAVAAGVVLFSAGVFLFMHYFLAGTKHYAVRDFLKTISLLTVAAALIFIVIRIFFFL